MAEQRVVVKLDVNSENVESFIKSISNNNIPIELYLPETAQTKVKKQTEDPIAKGIGEGAKKGNETLRKETNKSFIALKGGMGTLSNNLTKALTDPISAMSSTLSSLGGLAGGLGIGLIASNMLNVWQEAHKELLAFQNSLRENFSTNNIENLEGMFKSLSQSINMSALDFSNFTARIYKDMGILGGDIGEASYFASSLKTFTQGNKSLEEGIIQYSKLLGEGKEITEKGFYELGRAVNSQEFANQLKKMQEEGTLNMHTFRKEILEFMDEMNKLNPEVSLSFLGKLWGGVKDFTTDLFTGTTKPVRTLTASLKKLDPELEKIYSDFQKLESNKTITMNAFEGASDYKTYASPQKYLENLMREMENYISSPNAFSFMENSSFQDSLIKNIEKDLAIFKEKGKDLTEESANAMIESFNKTIATATGSGLDFDFGYAEAQKLDEKINNTKIQPQIQFEPFDELTDKLKEIYWQKTLIQQTPLGDPYLPTYMNDLQGINDLLEEEIQKLEKEKEKLEQLKAIRDDITKSDGERLEADEWIKAFENRQRMLTQAISQVKGAEFFDSEKIEEELQQIHDRAEELLDVKGKITLDPSSKSQLLADLNTLDQRIAEMQKFGLDLSESDQKLLENLKAEREGIWEVLEESDDWGAEYGKTAAQYITEASDALAGILHGIANNGVKGGVYAGTKSTLNFASSFDPTGASSAIVGGITSIFSGVDALWQASIERKMDAIILEDTKFINEFNEVKDAEIKAYQDHVKELNEQFNKSKSVYDKMYSMGAIGGDAYNEAMGGLTNTVGAEIKDTNEKIQVAQLQKQMLDSYIARKQELQREQMEMRKWGVWDSSAYQDTTDRLGKIEGAISSIEGASSLAELEPFPRNAINYAYHGFDGYTNKPTLFMTSEYGQKEKVSITPSYRLSQGFDSMGHPAPLSNSYDSSFLRNSGSGGSTGGGISIGDINIVVNGAGDLNEEELSAKLTQKIIASIKKEFALGGYGGR